MRDLTKSMIGFSWAMSMFGVQQTVNILSPSRATQAFNNVIEATRKEFGGITDSTFRAGESLQRGLVDVTFSVFSPQMLDPNNWIKMTSGMAQQAMGVLGQVIPGASGPPTQQTGWGPVPPPGK